MQGKRLFLPHTKAQNRWRMFSFVGLGVMSVVLIGGLQAWMTFSKAQLAAKRDDFSVVTNQIQEVKKDAESSEDLTELVAGLRALLAQEQAAPVDTTLTEEINIEPTDETVTGEVAGVVTEEPVTEVQAE